MVTEYCADCMFVSRLSSFNMLYCNFMERNRRRRLCRAGDGCEEKITREDLRQLKSTSFDTERAKELLLKGVIVREAAETLGVPVGTLRGWIYRERQRAAQWTQGYDDMIRKKAALEPEAEEYGEAGATQAPEETEPEAALEPASAPRSCAPISEIRLEMDCCGCKIIAYAPHAAAAMRLLERLAGI